MTQHDHPSTGGAAQDLPRADHVAAWVEQRLHDSLGCSIAPARLYALEVLDPAGFVERSVTAARLTFVAEADDATALVLGAAAAEAVESGDGLVLAATRWEQALVPLPRPGGHPVRRRARVVTVVTDAGTASALRFDHQPDEVVVARGLSIGGIAGVQLAATWSARAG